jgi:TolB protein
MVSSATKPGEPRERLRRSAPRSGFGSAVARVCGLRLAGGAALATCMILFGATPAHATFPGNNGRIAFSQGFEDLRGHSQVFTIRPDGGGVRRLTSVASDQSAKAPDWSPDGQEIAYESNQSGSLAIWVMNANGSGQTQLTDPAAGGFADRLPSWSPDGNRILFSRCGRPFGFIAYCDIDVMNADGTGVETLLSAGHWTNLRAEYSPDGTRIAFSGDRNGLFSAVWVMNADGSSPTRLTPRLMQGGGHDWSPDGRRIVFSGLQRGFDGTRPPRINAWTVRVDGSGLKRLTDLRAPQEADLESYSPNGERIVSTPAHCPHSRCFRVMDTDGSHIHRVATGKSETLFVDWGPGS